MNHCVFQVDLSDSITAYAQQMYKSWCCMMLTGERDAI